MPISDAVQAFAKKYYCSERTLDMEWPGGGGLKVRLWLDAEWYQTEDDVVKLRTKVLRTVNQLLEVGASKEEILEEVYACGPWRWDGVNAIQVIRDGIGVMAYMGPFDKKEE